MSQKLAGARQYTALNLTAMLLEDACSAMAAAASPRLAPSAAENKDFKVAWSIYVGWMPWRYAAGPGIVKT